MITELLIGLLIVILCIFPGIPILLGTIDEIVARIDHKRLSRLLKDGNPLLKKLVEEIKRRKIVLVPFGFIELIEKLSQRAPKNIFRMLAIIRPPQKNKITSLFLKILWRNRPKIVLPENQIKEMLKERVNIGQLEGFLAHEIGHHIAGIEIFNCNIMKEQKRKGVINTCLFDELRATEEGLKLIDEIYGIKNWRIELQGKKISKENFCDYILGTVDMQCKDCIYEIVYFPDSCPKFGETFEVRKRIWKIFN